LVRVLARDSTSRSSTPTPRALAILGRTSDRGGLSLHSQKVMLG
jgi:hypothetical protein